MWNCGEIEHIQMKQVSIVNKYQVIYIPYHSHLLLLLNHVVIVVKLCCVVGLMEDRCTSNKHYR